MEAAVRKLEALCEKTDKDLDSVSRSLESDFGERLRGSGDEELNPVQLLQRTEDEVRSLEKIQKERKEIDRESWRLVRLLKDRLLNMGPLLRNLQSKAGEEISESDIEVSLQKLTLDVQPEGISRDVHGTDDDEKNDAESVTVEESGLSKAEEKKADLPKRTLPLSPTARRSGFVPLTEKEFFSVSDLVRGRIKLEDVNEVYRALYQHFQIRKNRMALTVRAMTDKGIKITGMSGQAKLKVLRALKLIQIDSKGSVKLIS
ncbi:spindle and kinetochore-associated protein 2-like [Oscarella lobularis]|uniref:spindle and kinetochore-associated protein 2-like n=1 Tax=Oscarella lobularis TaxID=121494 RepID=UPI003313BF7A